MIDFNKALFSIPMPAPLWLGLLMALNLVVPLYFIGSLEAQLTVAAFIVNAAVMTAMFAKMGFVRLLGIGHIFWVPLVVWLAMRLGAMPFEGLFAYWMAAVVVANALTLVVDARDVISYLRGGDRFYPTAEAKRSEP